MKLLGWMHRKFRQNSGDIFKDFTSGPTCNCLCARPSLEEHRHDSHRLQLRNQALFADEEFIEGDGEMVELLLTIGTLGSVPVEVREEAAEETVEAIAEKQAEAATEAELVVVGEELEKVLAAAEKGGDRLSFASWKGAAACPLQDYLFGSPVEAAETAESDGRRKRRASLGELFLMSSHEEAVRDGGEARSTAGMHLMMIKKLLKRRGPGSDSGSSGGGPRVTAAVESKFHKILKIFHKKVHPESTMVRQKHRKPRDKSTPRDGGSDSSRGGSGGGDPLNTSKGDWRKEGIPSLKSRSLGGESDSSGSREYWIKTDSDYLVLEL